MKYNGIELKEFTSDKPVVFNPPRTMLVWDRTDSEPCERDVVGYLPLREYRKVITRGDEYMFCAEIPETPKSRRATNRELVKWLAVTDELQALRSRVIELERIADGKTAGKNKTKKEA